MAKNGQNGQKVCSTLKNDQNSHFLDHFLDPYFDVFQEYGKKL